MHTCKHPESSTCVAVEVRHHEVDHLELVEVSNGSNATTGTTHSSILVREPPAGRRLVRESHGSRPSEKNSVGTRLEFLESQRHMTE